MDSRDAMMSRHFFLAAVAALITSTSAGYADTITGSYKAVNAGTGPYMPTINDDGGAFLPSPFSETLGVGVTTTPSTFLQVAPISGGSGTLSGSVDVAMTLSEGAGSAVTGVTTSAGGNTAFAANGTLYFAANYDIFYGSQTDCITWNASSCTSTNNTTTIGETLKVSFADGAVLDINLYNWSDWNMQPDISFDLVSGAGVPVPEPATLAIFATALAGLWMVRRRLAGHS
jgi:hypothetical protein